MPKYKRLTDHLLRTVRQPHGEYRVTFADIEHILGEPLPPSAYRHRPWWSNSPASLMAQSWLSAGWKTTQVDMQGQKLVFKRIRDPAPDTGGFSDHPPSPLSPPDGQPNSTALTVSGIDAPTLARLKAKAELTGRSIEDVARDLIVEGAILSPDERLAIADRVRARSPALHDIDMAAIIRQDRDHR